MTLLESIKPFWPLLFTFILPRALSYYREFKTAVRTRPTPRPLSNKASRALNILFFSVGLFLWRSLTTDSANDGLSNVFATTQTRLGVPGELLFARLALRRSNGMLTAVDEELRSKFTSMPLRQIYLRVGPEPILHCPFCQPEDPMTYALHALPTQILFPHLIHFLLVGLATSKELSGAVASMFRYRAAFTSIVLFAIDLYMMLIREVPLDTHRPGPFSMYAAASTFRPLIFCAIDAILAFLIFATATNRLVYFPFLASAADATEDPEELVEQTKSLLQESLNATQLTLMKLRGVNVTQNTIRRDETLKQTEDDYWTTVRQIETNTAENTDPSLFDEEEVQAAVARTFGSGVVNVASMRKEAEGFVREVTRPLDSQR